MWSGMKQVERTPVLGGRREKTRRREFARSARDSCIDGGNEETSADELQIDRTPSRRERSEGRTTGRMRSTSGIADDEQQQRDSMARTAHDLPGRNIATSEREPEERAATQCGTSCGRAEETSGDVLRHERSELMIDHAKIGRAHV